jgi:membrane protein
MKSCSLCGERFDGMKQQVKRTGMLKGILLLVLLEMFFFYLTQALVPSCNLLVEKVENSYVGYVNEHNGYKEVAFSEDGKGTVKSDLYHIDQEIEIDFSSEKGRASVPVTVLNLERFHPLTYQGAYDIVVHNAISKQLVTFFGLNLCLIVAVLFARRKKYGLNDFLSCFFYRSGRQKKWTYREWTILAIVILASFAVIPGIDLRNITRMSSNFASGGDIYQIQNLHEVELHKFDWVSYPYNPIMLVFYTIPNLLSFGFAPFYIQTPFLWLPALIFRACNAVLMRETILSMQGYMMDEGVVQSEKNERSFWIAFLSPVAFYVAIIFIQLDILPIFLVTEGLIQLLRNDANRGNQRIGSILMGVGCFCKLQNVLMFPMCALVYFVLIWKKRQNIINAGLFLVAFLLNVASVYVFNPIIGIFLSRNVQGNRVWLTIFSYVEGGYIYLTLFFVVLLLMLAAMQYKASMTNAQLCIGTLLANGALILLFSATILDTLSSYVIAFPAFIYVLCHEKDELRRWLIWGMSIVILVIWALVASGDITSGLHYFGRSGIFEQLESSLAGTIEGKHWGTIIFTLSRSGLSAYVILFFGEMKRLLESGRSIGDSAKQ